MTCSYYGKYYKSILSSYSSPKASGEDYGLVKITRKGKEEELITV
jgi:hypothetical protein